MSASTDKKKRQEARAAGTDKKMLAAQEAARKAAVSKRRWTIGTVLVVLLIVAILVSNSSLLYRATTALKAGSVKLSPAQVNYYYGDSYRNFINNYSSYASVLGLDTSGGVSALKGQSCSMTDGGTWRDYFLDTAEQTIPEVLALKEYAEKNGVELTDEEIAAVDANFEGIDEYAKKNNYSNANALFAMNYGKGVTTAMVRQGALDQALASKAYNHALESFTYTPEELEEYYAGLNGDRDLFSYLVYDVKGSVAEGEEAPSEEALMEAAALADAISMAYQDGGDIEDITERFEVAVDSQTGETGEIKPTSRSRVTGSGLSADYKEWLTGSREEGDIFVVPDSDNSGTSVVVFLSRDDNHYATANVRHILIRAVAGEDGTYSDEAKAEAKARAEEILAEFEAGDKTEESFAALAEQYSEDSGSNTNGGLYESVPKGQMVAEFDAFCFDGHKPGDTAIVYGESSSYAGYHVMYYVGEGDLYSNVIAQSALRSEDVSNWIADLVAPYEVSETYWIRLVG